MTRRKPPVPRWRWALWLTILAAADFVFYVLLTPLWLGLRAADIVLVGVSRTSKTPLSIYLGYLGHKTANVPVVKGIEPPQELFAIDATKIVGLTIDAERLAEIRTARLKGMGGGGNRHYAELLEIYEELEEAEALHRRLGCPVVDVTGLSIEETAHRAVRLVETRRSEVAGA